MTSKELQQIDQLIAKLERLKDEDPANRYNQLACRVSDYAFHLEQMVLNQQQNYDSLKASGLSASMLDSEGYLRACINIQDDYRGDFAEVIEYAEKTLDNPRDSKPLTHTQLRALRLLYQADDSALAAVDDFLTWLESNKGT